MKINLAFSEILIKHEKFFKEISQNIIKMYYKLIRYFSSSSSMSKMWFQYMPMFDVIPEHSLVNKYKVLML
ncbi:hypothetical protein NIES2101_25565 [Calothrix sp. HK-06]|nr:hypothetical protein NIES2101_25565 [Calothrix sp. HK-06]